MNRDFSNGTEVLLVLRLGKNARREAPDATVKLIERQAFGNARCGRKVARFVRARAQ